MAKVPNAANAAEKTAENFNRLSMAYERYRQTIDGRATAYSKYERKFTFAKNGSPYAIGPLILSCLTICLSGCLSVTLVCCGQTVGLIKMKLGMEVGLEPGHIVLSGQTDRTGQQSDSIGRTVTVAQKASK